MFIHIFMLIISIGFSQAEVYIYKLDVGIYYKFHRQPQTWAKAISICKSENATLAMPRDETEAATIQKVFESYPKSTLTGVKNPNYVLLGFHDIFTEGEFITLTGKSIQYYYHKWAGSQPDNLRNEDCGSMGRSGDLNDFPCSTSSVFICEKREYQDTYPPNKKCESLDPAYELVEYKLNELSKYYKLHLNPRNWPDARTICDAEGGYLAIITSKEEEEHLAKLFNKPENFIRHSTNNKLAFIGFHDSFQENVYMTVFSDNINDLGYVNWATGEPNDKKRKENCGAINVHGQLNDFSCTAVALFICEIPLC